MMLGEMRLAGRMYARNEPTLVGNGKDLREELATVTAALPKSIYEPVKQSVAAPLLEQVFPAPEDIKPNAYVIVNDQIGIREDDQISFVEGLPEQRAQRIRGMIRVRDAVRCLRTQIEATEEGDLAVTRHQLNQIYDRFVSRFGFLSERSNTISERS